MRVLVWQWGRRGAGPYLATELATALHGLPGVTALLALSQAAELLREKNPPRCDMALPAYRGAAGLLARLLTAPLLVARLCRQIAALRPDIAVCVMPGPLDLLMALALRLTGTKFLVMIHDADAHPGDGSALLMWLQRRLARQADGLITLSSHVAERLRQLGLPRPPRPIWVFRHPPRRFDTGPAPPFHHGGKPRLLFFGRLLAYKGLDLLTEALSLPDPMPPMELRVIGQGPESETLAALRATADVMVENRWVEEAEIDPLIFWADALVLPYREASQSGIAAAAVGAGRWTIVTRVGGLQEQLQDEPLALFCEPRPESLAAAMRDFCAAKPQMPDRVLPATAWHNLAEALVARIGTDILTAR